MPDPRLPPSNRASPARPLAGTILYCLVTDAHVCKQLAQDCSAEWWPGLKPATC